VQLKVCGFSFIKDAVKFDYPIKEALLSILPLCDEVFVAVGKSTDSTRQLVASISSKITIIDTVWDENLRSGGAVLATETNKAIQAIPKHYDWCIYIQGDELLHENDYDTILKAMHASHQNPKIEGLLFKYRHFYGSYDYIATSGRWYKHEIRIIKNNINVFSYGDAMGFRIRPNKKLDVKSIDAHVYHYGWVKHPKHQQDKQKEFHKWWTTDQELNQKVDISINAFDYNQIDKLELFKGTHPSVIVPKIQQQNWNFDFDPTIDRRSLKEKIRSKIQAWTGWRPGEYKNYRIVSS
jgi:hypothetical protein